MPSLDNGGHTLLWFVYKSNDSIPDVKFWNSTKNSHLPNLDVVFELTISGKFPCAHPTGNNTCASNKIELTTDAWTSNGVDKFFEKWYDRRSSGFKADGGMMQAFGKDFKIGDLWRFLEKRTSANKFDSGNDHTCTIDNSCQLVSSCDDLPNHGVDGNSAQIYLIWQALQNISDMFNRMYNNLNIAEGDTMTKIAQIALEFYTPIKAATPPPNPLLMDSGILGSLSALGGLIPGVGSGISAAFGFASGLTGAINSQKAAAPPPPDPQFAESDAQLGVVFGKYANQMRTQLQKIHSSIFTAGENVTSLLSEGAYVDRTALNVDCSDCIPKAQAWLEQLLTLKMINYMWLRQNVFVTYMPYGTVIQLDTLEQTEFTGRDCHDNFLSRDDEKHLVACMPKGMGRLTYYNPALASTTEPDPDGSVKLNGMPPGADKEQSYNSTEAISVGFKSTSAVISSVAGFFEGGLGYDAITSLTSLILSGGNQGTVSWGSGSTQIGHDAGYYLQQLWQVNATTAGMFTLPVCQIRDLNYWPTFYGQDNRRAYNDYCICWNDLNPDFKDHVTGDFRKFVTTWRQGECGKGHGTEPAIGGSDVGLAPRGTRNPDYKPLPWP